MSYSISASYLPGQHGRLFTLHYQPDRPAESGICILVSPPLGEEMNRCRYMCNLLAQEATGLGMGLLNIDPFGTGDSEGLYRQTNWQTLEEALLLGADKAKSLGYHRVILLGIRVGALVAMDIAPRIPNLHSLIFWQPSISGQSALTQLLRIKLAASLGRSEDAGSIKQFEQMSSEGQMIEISGYEVSPEHFQSLKQAHFEQSIDAVEQPIYWLTTLASAERKPPRAESQFLEKWVGNGKKIEHFEVIAPPFWQVHERTLAPTVIEQTVTLLKEMN